MFCSVIMHKIFGLCSIFTCCLASAATHSGDGLADMLFMADIGHAREHKDRLQSPWPMGKSAYEGAFSLYDGIRDLVVNQGVRPKAAVIIGDVAYGGGENGSCNDTRDAFQNYTDGHLPIDRVFPLIGNHDVHYLGCLDGEDIDPFASTCYYGTATALEYKSEWQMNFTQWRGNWLSAFPGLKDSTVAFAPPKSAPRAGPSDWLAPNRYNINLDSRSTIYFISSIITGSGVVNFNGDTPLASIDVAAPNGTMVECLFLRDSLAHGRSLGKTVFIYMTHDFRRVCDDWELFRQVDVWIYGHVHNYWDNLAGQKLVRQEDRYFPLRILIGNGGFDEGMTDVVSFGRLWEEISSDDGDRVHIHFDIFDTCTSNETCPSSDSSLLAHCWCSCKDVPGGYDGGGGARKAVPSQRHPGFVFDAPRKASARSQLFQGARRMRLGHDNKFWVALGACESSLPSNARCLVPTVNRSEGAVFHFYSVTWTGIGNFWVRLAVDDEQHGPIVRSIDSQPNNTLYRRHGYWDMVNVTTSAIVPNDGVQLNFVQSEQGSIQVNNLAWINNKSGVASHLAVVGGTSLDVFFDSLDDDFVDASPEYSVLV